MDLGFLSLRTYKPYPALERDQRGGLVAKYEKKTTSTKVVKAWQRDPAQVRPEWMQFGVGMASLQ